MENPPTGGIARVRIGDYDPRQRDRGKVREMTGYFVGLAVILGFAVWVAYGRFKEGYPDKKG